MAVSNETLTHILGTIGIYSNSIGVFVGFVLIIRSISLITVQYHQQHFSKLTSFYALNALICITVSSIFAALESYYLMSYNETYYIFSDRIQSWSLYDMTYFFFSNIGQVSVYLFLINRLKHSLNGISRRIYILFNILSVIIFLLGLYGIVIIYQYESNDLHLSTIDRLLNILAVVFCLILSAFLAIIIIYLFIAKSLQIVIKHKLHHHLSESRTDKTLSSNEKTSIITMCSDIFNIKQSQQIVLNTTASIIVISSILLTVSILYLIYVLIWYVLYGLMGVDEDFKHCREFGVTFVGILGIVDTLCIYVSLLDYSNKRYQCLCGCFHQCWLRISKNYAERHVRIIQIQRKHQPLLIPSSNSTIQSQSHYFA